MDFKFAGADFFISDTTIEIVDQGGIIFRIDNITNGYTVLDRLNMFLKSIEENQEITILDTCIDISVDGEISSHMSMTYNGKHNIETLLISDALKCKELLFLTEDRDCNKG